jgi:hypothetical protein
MILHSIDTTHSSDIAKVWTTVASKALELFDQISLQDGPLWRLWCNRPNCPPVELSKCATTERYSREIVPELGGCPAALRTFLAFDRRLKSISRRRDLRCPPSFSTLRPRFLSRRHSCSRRTQGRGAYMVSARSKVGGRGTEIGTRGAWQL